jgi:hypothetical protein
VRRAAAGLLLLWCGCGTHAAKETVHPVVTAEDERFTGPWSPPPARDADVVAEVNGEKIYVADVERQAQARGQTPLQALDELIAAELLVEEARRKGLTDDPEVVAARRRERARLILDRDFAPTFDSPDQVPQAEVDAFWNMERVRTFYDHPEYHNVSYVRAPTRLKTTDEAELEAARALAQRFHDAAIAAHVTTSDAYFALADRLAKDWGVKLQHERYSTTEHKGPATPEFAAAAFSVSTAGELAKPARTDWGYDVLLLTEVIPARHTSKEEAAVEIRKQRFEAARRTAFLRWADGLVAQHQIERHDELLGGIDLGDQ